jgi:hypothetical protein
MLDVRGPVGEQRKLRANERNGEHCRRDHVLALVGRQVVDDGVSAVLATRATDLVKVGM